MGGLDALVPGRADHHGRRLRELRYVDRRVRLVRDVELQRLDIAIGRLRSVRRQVELLGERHQRDVRRPVRGHTEVPRRPSSVPVAQSAVADHGTHVGIPSCVLEDRLAAHPGGGRRGETPESGGVIGVSHVPPRPRAESHPWLHKRSGQPAGAGRNVAEKRERSGQSPHRARRVHAERVARSVRARAGARHGPLRQRQVSTSPSPSATGGPLVSSAMTRSRGRCGKEHSPRVRRRRPPPTSR